MKNGFIAITCDYLCDGNSSGDTVELTYPKMINSVKSIYDYLCNHHSIDQYALVGLRLGANVAISASDYILNLKKMILFELVINPL